MPFNNRAFKWFATLNGMALLNEMYRPFEKAASTINKETKSVALLYPVTEVFS